MAKLGPENVCIVQMGHYGDIINLLPVAYHLHCQGKKVWWLVEPKHRDIFEATTYVEPVTDIDCSGSFREMIRQANAKFEYVILGGIWDFQIQGEPICQSYSLEHWRIAGYLEHFYNPEFKLVFDRLPFAEPVPQMPILANLTHGLSSPFPYGLFLLQKLQAAFPGMVEDIGPIRLPKFLDLIHLVRGTRCLVTMDTGTLWIAETCPEIPTVAVVSHMKWGGSVLRRPLQARISYREAQFEPATVINAVGRVIGKEPALGWQKSGNPIIDPKWPDVFRRGTLNGESEIQLRHDAIKAWQHVLEGAVPCIFFERTMNLIAERLQVKTDDLIEFSGRRKLSKVPKLP